MALFGPRSTDQCRGDFGLPIFFRLACLGRIEELPPGRLASSAPPFSHLYSCYWCPGRFAITAFSVFGFPCGRISDWNFGSATIPPSKEFNSFSQSSIPESRRRAAVQATRRDSHTWTAKRHEAIAFIHSHPDHAEASSAPDRSNWFSVTDRPSDGSWATIPLYVKATSSSSFLMICSLGPGVSWRPRPRSGRHFLFAWSLLVLPASVLRDACLVRYRFPMDPLHHRSQRVRQRLHARLGGFGMAVSCMRRGCARARVRPEGSRECMAHESRTAENLPGRLLLVMWFTVLPRHAGPLPSRRPHLRFG